MLNRLRAVYQAGMFIPEEPFDLPENTHVELIVNDPYTCPPEITDPAERSRILEQIVADMKSNPFPASAPRLTREELHERR